MPNKNDIRLTIVICFLISTAVPATVIPEPAVDPDLLAATDIPIDVSFPGLTSFTFETLQPHFDRLSWDTFVAINRPTRIDGAPDGTKIGAAKDNLTAWELWKEDYEIFLEGGAEPAAWGAERQPPSYFSEKYKKLFREKQKDLKAKGKPLTVLEASVEPFDSGPLIDQNGRYARFEILVNQTMFEHIRGKRLYSKAGQEFEPQDVVFPCGREENGKKEQGSIMIKAAWKVLSEEEKSSGRFHTRDCLIYTRPSELLKTEEHCDFATVGLVGLHIVHKTPSRPQWIWSTFEHVDNCPTNGQQADSSQTFSFYSNVQQPELLATNSPPMPPWNPTVVEPPPRRSQIKRMQPIRSEAQLLNKRFREALTGSVWKNYQLISTQWPSSRQKGCDPQQSAPVDIIAMPAPQFLGNSTLESYVPGRVVNVSSSCIECHANATMTNGRFSDFTYLLLRAK